MPMARYTRGVPALNFNYRVVNVKEGQSSNGDVLPSDDFKSFGPASLGLGDISREGKTVQALAAVFDLSGFTSFCSQPESQLVIPEFLDAYLNWIFKELANQMKERESEGKVVLWCRLPFFAKFLGDGLLFLWDTVGMTRTEMSILIISVQNVLDEYRDTFLPKIKKCVSSPPPALRCGIARGQIIAVGNGEDFVGPCINIASRLQRLGSLSFAVSRRGMAFQDTDNDFWKDFQVKRVGLPGIGENELVYVRKKEFTALTAAEKNSFHEP
jgi:class 3 adenylate cyclase